MRRTALVLCLLCTAPNVLAAPLELEFPTAARLAASETLPADRLAIPQSGWRDGQMETSPAEGAVRFEAWQIATPGMTPTQILAPLRAQLEQQGFVVTFECATAECGGFEFRYALDLIPEPAMHVDLGNFRFLAAKNEAAPPQNVMLLASQTAERGYLHVTQIAPSLGGVSSGHRGPGAADTAARPTAVAPVTSGALGEGLVARGHVVLDDLTFQPGSSRLADGSFESLAALAAFLRENTDIRIVLVGHTDTDGTLEANIALSRKRAAAVRERLATNHGVPIERMQAEGVGFLAPLESNATEDGRNANRRVEVILSGSS